MNRLIFNVRIKWQRRVGYRSVGLGAIVRGVVLGLKPRPRDYGKDYFFSDGFIPTGATRFECLTKIGNILK